MLKTLAPDDPDPDPDQCFLTLFFDIKFCFYTPCVILKKHCSAVRAFSHKQFVLRWTPVVLLHGVSVLFLTTTPPPFPSIAKQGGLVVSLENLKIWYPQNRRKTSFWGVSEQMGQQIFSAFGRKIFVAKQGGLVVKGELVVRNRTDPTKWMCNSSIPTETMVSS